jgi:hypothetical protein
LGKYILVRSPTPFDPLPQELDTFLGAAIESYEQLAVLLLLHRERNRDWAQGEMGNALGIPPDSVHSTLAGLCKRQLLCVARDDCEPLYRYAASGSSDALVERLSVEYFHNPARLMRSLSAHAIRRVRTSAIRAFADSFVIGEKDTDRG